jgi:(heptosyl)LPS beta-1,4-glucosyltransferase
MEKMAKLSVVINVVDWEVSFLPNVIKSVKDISDEIVLIDMTSTSEVEKIAEEFKAKVEKHEYVEYVEPVRNFGISKASGEWVLILDPDEELPSELREKIGDILVNSESKDYYRISRKNVIFGKWIKHARWWPDYNIRLFRKGTVTWNEVIHSVPMTTGEGADLDAKESLAIHHNHYSSIEQYVERLNRYTTQHAKLLSDSGYKFSWKDILSKPTDEFLSRYFFAKGFTDGVHGLALSLLQAFSELIKYLKVWQLEKFEEKSIPVESVIEELKVSQKNVAYWEADTLLSRGGGLLERIKRKLRIL